MGEVLKHRIRVNKEKLVQGLRADEVMDYMYQYELIDAYDLERVDNCRMFFSNVEAVSEMLDCIMSKSGLDVFDKFCLALRESGYERLIGDCNITKVLVTGQSEPDILKRIQVSVQGDYHKITAIILDLEQQNALYKQENRQLKDEMNRKGFTDKNVVDFVEIFMTTARDKGLGGAGGSSEKPHQMELRLLPNGSQIACRLSIDIVCYYAAIELCHPPPEPFSSIAVAFRAIVVEVVTKHADVFEDSLKVINKDSIYGFETLATIADELFDSNNSWKWGRVVVWYALCAYIGRGLASEAEKDTLETFAMYIWFLINQRYQKKLEQNGGWDAFVAYVKVINNPLMSWISSPWISAVDSCSVL